MANNPNKPNKRIAIFGGITYGHPDLVRRVIASLPPASTTLIITANTGMCKVAYQEALIRQIPMESHRWKGKVHRALECAADHYIVFMDEDVDIIITLIQTLAERKIPQTIYNPLGNEVDFQSVLALHSKSTGARKMPTVTEKETTPVANTIPKGDETKLRVTLVMPESLHQIYESQAKIRRLPYPESAMLERLKSCAAHNSSRAIYFDDAQRTELEKLLGGKFLQSADSALHHLRGLVTIKMGTLDVQLDAKLLARCESRAIAERTTVGKWIERELIKGLEAAVGLR